MDGTKAVQINAQKRIWSIIFTEDSQRIFTGGDEGVIREWNVEDGKEVGEGIKTSSIINAIALSKDRKWIISGEKNMASIWDRKTREKGLSVRHEDWVIAVDVAPDSSMLATGSTGKTACIWDIRTGQRLIGPLQHDNYVAAVRFSPNGDRLATATYTQESLRVYDAHTGSLIFNVPVKVSSTPSTPLVWSSDGQTIYMISHGIIKCIDTSTGSILSEHKSHDSASSSFPSIALASNEKFIVSSNHRQISLLNTFTQSQLGSLMCHESQVHSIAISPDDHYLASGEATGKIIIRNLHNILPDSFRSIDLPFLRLSSAAFNFWNHGDLTSTEALLTSAITHSPVHALAHRALLRASSRDYEAAYRDAKESIRIQPSVEGYIAMSIALVGKGQMDIAMRLFDLAFDECDRSDVKLLLLIKSIVSFLAGNHDDALWRVQDLIDKVDEKSTYRTVQAQLHVLLGEIHTKRGDIERAIKALKQAQSSAPFPTNPHLTTISLIFGWNIDKLGITIQLHLFEALRAAGHTAELSQSLFEMDDALHEKVQMKESSAEWEINFATKCVATFENNGDKAMDSGDYEEAVAQYSTALSLSPPHPSALLVKRSKARAASELWEEALEDANEVIAIDPSSPWGYERKHAALHGAERYDEAIGAFARMLFALENSDDEAICQMRKNHVTQQETIATIDAAIDDISKTCPLVLIDVTTGCLCDKAEQIRLFKSGKAFKELVSSMTAELDRSRILRTIESYFQYVMLSHVWQGEEPTFQDVTSVKSIWKLGPSVQTSKLHGFCQIVRNDGGRFAWSDTCCIDKTISTTLNQSLTSMYAWYENSAATFVHLADVDSPSMPGDLEKSRWMTRAWTSQEGLAPKTIRFYDKQWKPYLNDTRANHKESPIIMQEFANATHLNLQNVVAFRPSDLSVREKLRLASSRNARFEEDIAYSLIGIFESDITPRYGEGGEVALGHLLEEIVSRSGEATVLAWVGKSSGYNSTLPASLSVYGRTPYTPPPIDDVNMETRVAELRSTLPQHEAMMIYDRITHLPSARFANRRLHLPCVVFPVQRLISHVGNVYRVRVVALGDVDITTTNSHPMSDPRKLFLVHPWIRDILDRTHPLDGLPFQGEFEFSQPISPVDSAPSSPVDSAPSSPMYSAPSSPVYSAPSSPVDSYSQALRLVVQLGQPFSALLLERQPRREFRRVATDQEIIVQAKITSVRDVSTAVLEIL